ncbi:hypothetical protein P7C73_g1269, partial [Tremellales sp. Uapishka_1]
MSLALPALFLLLSFLATAPAHAVPLSTQAALSVSLPLSTSLSPSSLSSVSPSGTSSSPFIPAVALQWSTASSTASATPLITSLSYQDPFLVGSFDASSSPANTTWAAPPSFSDMSTFSVSAYAAGVSNLAVLLGSPAPVTNTTTATNNTGASVASLSTQPAEEPWDASPNSLQIFYPKGSINPGNQPQGGSEFYASPLDVTSAKNATLQYSVYFPIDFDFVKGGKLPGLYGGHKGCSGGNAAVDCFSTRMMWRTGGKGELYLYAPKDKQTPSLCQTAPQSVCDSQYGLSIGRGAWTFPRGDWTTIRQDVWLNTPGQNDGGFNVWINGRLVISANDVYYRENAAFDQDTIDQAYMPSGVAGNATVNATFADTDEDWESAAAQKRDLVVTTATVATTVWETAYQIQPTTLTETVYLTASPTPTAMAIQALAEPSLSPDPELLPAPFDASAAVSIEENKDGSIGFIGLFFSTFFGGHTADWATPKDQYTYFKDFAMSINA